MLARSWITIILLINYLVVVGAGCVNRPEDQHEFLIVQTQAEGYHYQQCRYLRMDGLESFLAEALASRYQTAHKTTHHLISVVSGIDTHSLPQQLWFLPAPVYQTTTPVTWNELAITFEVHKSVYAPPWLG